MPTQADLIASLERTVICLRRAVGLANWETVPDGDDTSYWEHAADQAEALLQAALAAWQDAPSALVAPGDVLDAAGALLDRLDRMTSFEFERGGERIEREALRAAVAHAVAEAARPGPAERRSQAERQLAALEKECRRRQELLAIIERHLSGLASTIDRLRADIASVERVEKAVKA